MNRAKDIAVAKVRLGDIATKTQRDIDAALVELSTLAREYERKRAECMSKLTIACGKQQTLIQVTLTTNSPE